MNLLITKAFDCDDYEMSQLKEIGYNIDVFDDERQKVLHPEKYDAVICNQLFLYNNIKDFKNLKAIQLTSAGFDRISVDYCEEKNIKVFNAKGVYSIPMAEWCVLQVLNTYKNLSFFSENKLHKKWEKNRNLFELYKKTVCIVGFGNVGQEVAKRFKAFDTNIVAVDIIENNSILYDEFYYISDIKNALKKSDIIILTLPLTSQTRGLFDSQLFSFMKENSILINISRGLVIKENDLIDFIKKGKFLNVCLDVFETEPLREKSELWELDNVFISPHNSFVGENNKKRLFEVIFNNLKEVCE